MYKVTNRDYTDSKANSYLNCETGLCINHHTAMFRTNVMSLQLDCVLLIDDDEPTNVLHQIILEEVGVAQQIRIAQSGYEALDYLRTCDLQGNMDMDKPFPELVFLDINMPGMNGFEFLEEYHQLDLLSRETTIVMLTTSLNPDDAERARHIPQVKGYKNKPLTELMVSRIMEEYFDW